MPKYIPYDYQQTAMVVINFEDQLQPGTFEHALHYLVDNKLDLTLFDPQYRNDNNGRPAYDPALLLKIILYGYSKGITSSREIEWQCQHNVIFKDESTSHDKSRSKSGDRPTTPSQRFQRKSLHGLKCECIF